MCIGIPMQVVDSDPYRARCQGRAGESTIDLSLVGPQPAGTWILTFQDHAREVIDADRALQINLALDALEAVMRGGEIDIDRCFPDLPSRQS